MERLNNEKFIERALKVHNGSYSYDHTKYINTRTKVKILCNECGDIFEQRPNSHLSGNGCKKCYTDTIGNRCRTDIKDFIEKAKKKHSDFYIYDLVNYTSNKEKIRIVCPVHGEFEQTPSNHLNGHRCPLCFNKLKDILYIKQNLTIEERPIEIDNKIQCKCTYCKEYFIPTKVQLLDRIRSLNGKRNGENRLYCSDKCKELCPIFHKISFFGGIKLKISRPDQPELRKLVLERDDNQCQRCGSSEDLHCHHITGVEINPVESADIDNCITLCYTCHSKAHSEYGCSMKRQKCNKGD